MEVAEWAAPKEDEYIIDVCAAPGGKSLHLADKLAGKGHVEARDLTPYKVDLIRDNIARIGIDNIEAVCQDATVYDEASEKKADILIADLPCSGLGVLGKKTDLKYKMNPDTQEVLLGDIVICVSRVYAQAKEYGHSVKREYAFLITHSMLHLMGYDHMVPEDAALMEAHQREILNTLQITR